MFANSCFRSLFTFSAVHLCTLNKMADWCGATQGLMGCLGYANYSSLLLMRCISERNKVGNTLLYSSPLSSYHPSYTAGRKRP